MNWFNFIFMSSHQPLLHICNVALQFVVQIDLKSHHHGIILKHHHGFIQKHEERRHANEVSPVLAESFRSLWPECLLARGFHFSEPAVTIFTIFLSENSDILVVWVFDLELFWIFNLSLISLPYFGRLSFEFGMILTFQSEPHSLPSAAQTSSQSRSPVPSCPPDNK